MLKAVGDAAGRAPLHRLLHGPLPGGREPQPKSGSSPCSRRSAGLTAGRPRLLAVGHVTWDRVEGGDVLGGSASYAALAAKQARLGAAVLTSAGPTSTPLATCPASRSRAPRLPRPRASMNSYAAAGSLRQVLRAAGGRPGAQRLFPNQAQPGRPLAGPGGWRAARASPSHASMRAGWARSPRAALRDGGRRRPRSARAWQTPR